MEVLLETINKLGYDIPENITEHSVLRTDLGLDSLAFMEVMYELEDTLGKEIPIDDIDEVVTIKDLLKYIE